MRSSVSSGEIRRTASELCLKVIVTRWIGAMVMALAGSLAAQEGSEPVADEGVLLQQGGMSELVMAWQELGKRRCGDDQPVPAAEAPSRRMTEPGTAMVWGGANVMLMKGGPQEVMLPLVQFLDGQVPLGFAIKGEPAASVKRYRIKRRTPENWVILVELEAKAGSRVSLNWAAVVLLRRASPSHPAEPESAAFGATACVQSEAQEIKELAGRLWPEGGDGPQFARQIQQMIMRSSQRKPPRKLDALGILDSGANSICTANANLACALLRSKGIVARSHAVVPTTGQKLEMHRVVSFVDQGKWCWFDPSLVHDDIPMHPWQVVVMGSTTIDDEQRAMKPRLGSMVGVPYGQELESITDGVSVFGQEFFWTCAVPLASFEPDTNAWNVARNSWASFLKTGVIPEGQAEYATISSSADLITRMKKD